VNEIFRQHVESLHPLFERLMTMAPLKVCDLPRLMPSRGIYLFSEGNAHLYVGRTNRLRTRLSEHCRKGSTHNSAPFAFLLARAECDMHSASYRPEGSRAELEKHEIFGPAFIAAKVRVRNMDVRFVEECDPLRQALLEMYVSIALATPHNSFENH
jgi:hypothetical protein